MIETEARLATNYASRYLADLSLAWIHSYPVRYDAITAEVELPGARLVMTADGDSLSLRLVGRDAESLEAAKSAVADHVDRLVGRHTGLRCDWDQLS